MRRTLAFLVGLFWPALTSVPAGAPIGEIPTGEYAKVAEAVKGTWDMARRQGGLPVLFVIRQPGNMYPSFWGGKLTGGTLKISAQDDALSGELICTSQGGFEARIVRFPPKYGMEKTIPGGVWMNAGKDLDMSLAFDTFTGWRYVPGKTPVQTAVRMQANYTATFKCNGRSIPLKGVATFDYGVKLSAFAFACTVTFNGSDMGLTGSQAGALEMNVRIKGPISIDKPNPDERSLDVN